MKVLTLIKRVHLKIRIYYTGLTLNEDNICIDINVRQWMDEEKNILGCHKMVKLIILLIKNSEINKKL